MIKTIFAAIFLSLSIGCTFGYFLSEHNLRLANAKLNRRQLELRYKACLGRDVNLERYPDQDLNDELFACETAQRKAATK